MLARNLPVIKAGCNNLQIHSIVNGLLFCTGKERYNSPYLNIGSLSPRVFSEARLRPHYLSRQKMLCPAPPRPM